jgi:hypothetical protein
MTTATMQQRKAFRGTFPVDIHTYIHALAHICQSVLTRIVSMVCTRVWSIAFLGRGIDTSQITGEEVKTARRPEQGLEYVRRKIRHLFIR